MDIVDKVANTQARNSLIGVIKRGRGGQAGVVERASAPSVLQVKRGISLANGTIETSAKVLRSQSAVIAVQIGSVAALS